jgi:hypothetical protein
VVVAVIAIVHKGHNSESNVFGVMPLFNLKFLKDES